MRFVLLKKIHWLVVDLEVIRFKREFQESKGRSLPRWKKKKKKMGRSKSLQVNSFVLKRKWSLLASLIF